MGIDCLQLEQLCERGRYGAGDRRLVELNRLQVAVEVFAREERVRDGARQLPVLVDRENLGDRPGMVIWQ